MDSDLSFSNLEKLLLLDNSDLASSLTLSNMDASFPDKSVLHESTNLDALEIGSDIFQQIE